MPNSTAAVGVSCSFFSTAGRAHFDDLDGCGTAYHGRYPDPLDRACIDYCAARGFPIGPEDVLVAFRTLDVQFHQFIRTGEPVETEFRSARPSRSTDTCTFVVERGDVLRATANRAITKIDSTTGRSKPWTDETRAAFQANDMPNATLRVAVS